MEVFMKKLIQELQELKALLTNNIVSKEWYYRELDEMLKHARGKEEIALINQYKNLDS